MKEDVCNAIPTPIFITDIEGKILYGNRSFMTLFKLDSLEGVYNETVFGKKNSISIFNIYEKLYDENYKVLKIHINDRTLEIKFYKNLKYIVGIVRDITDEMSNLELMKNYSLYLNLVKSIISTYFDEKDPTTAFQRILNDIMYYVDLVYTQVFIFDNEKLVLFQTLGDPPKELKKKTTFLMGEDTPGTAFQLEKIIFVKDPIADTRFKKLKRDNPLSLIDVPILRKDKKIGVLEFVANRQLSPVTNVIWDFFPQLLTVVSDLLIKMKNSKNIP